MKSLKKGFLVLTSTAMAVGALLVGGSIKETQEVKAADATNKIVKLVTSVDELTNGSQIYIANADMQNCILMSTEQKTSNRSGTSKSSTIKINSDNTIDSSTIPNNAQVITLEKKGTSGSDYYLKVDGGHLYAGSSSSNQLKTGTVSELPDNYCFNISFKGNVANLKAGGVTRNWIRYNGNSSSNLFSCYSSGQSDTCIFKITQSSFTVSFNLNGGEGTIASKTVQNGSTLDELPEVTRSGYTFGGWYLEEAGKDPVKWNIDMIVEKDMTLVAHWDDATLSNAKNALNNVTSYMSYGFKYDITSTKYGCVSMDKTTNLNEKKVVIVGKAKDTGKYYAMRNDVKESGTEVYLTSNNVLDMNRCFDKINSITWEVTTSQNSNDTDKFYNLKNPNGLFLSTPNVGKTSLDIVDITPSSTTTSIDYSVKEKSGSYLLQASGSSRFIFNQGETFKNYSDSNYNSVSYAAEMYIFVVGEGIEENAINITSYTNADFRLKCGINDSALTSATLPEGATYGIAVSTATQTVHYAITDKSINSVDNPTDSTPNKYVIIRLGDVINNIGRATTEFTTRAYLKVGDVYYYSDETNSENKKTYSIASLTEAAFNADVNEVLGLYMLLEEKGCYTAA